MSLSSEVFIFPGFPTDHYSMPTRSDCFELLHNYMAFPTRNLNLIPPMLKRFPQTLDVEAADSITIPQLSKLGLGKNLLNDNEGSRILFI